MAYRAKLVGSKTVAINLDAATIDIIKEQGRDFNFSDWIRNTVKEKLSKSHPEGAAHVDP